MVDPSFRSYDSLAMRSFHPFARRRPAVSPPIAISIGVTAADIEAGTRNHAQRNPLALAIMRQLDVADVHVSRPQESCGATPPAYLRPQLTSILIHSAVSFVVEVAVVSGMYGLIGAGIRSWVIGRGRRRNRSSSDITG